MLSRGGYTQARAQLSVLDPLIGSFPFFQVLAEALLGFLDVDRNGKIEGGELKVLLAMLGFPAALLLPIPKFISIDYRSILKRLEGGSAP